MQSLIRYFEKHIPSIDKDYQWKIPDDIREEFGIPNSGSLYNENVLLKMKFKEQWEKADSSSRRVELANLVIRDWGGIRTNRESTVRRYVDDIEKGKVDVPLQGISSSSKILAIVDPDKYAIYDARVAAALVAAQFLHGANCSQDSLAFRYVPSRNKAVSDFTKHSMFKRKQLSRIGWKSISSRETYKCYLETLHKLVRKLQSSKDFSDVSIYTLEMSLFANAEKLIERAIKNPAG